MQRLRGGISPQPWPVHLTALFMVSVTVALILIEFHSESFVREMSRSSRVGSVVLVELFVVGGAIAMSIGTWWNGRRDRRIVGRIRASRPEPALFLPVSTKGIRTSEDFPRPRPAVWTIDGEGLHGWAPDREGPVKDVSWPDILRIHLATKDSRGSRIGYALWFDLDDGRTLVLPPRTSLGRPFTAGPGGLETLLLIVHDLQRTLGEQPVSRRGTNSGLGSSDGR